MVHFVRHFHRIIKFAATLSALSILIMLLITAYDVLMRYAFSRPTGWADEISEYLLVACVFLSLAWVSSERGHVRTEIVLQRLGWRRRKAAEIYTIVVSLLFTLVLTWQGFELALSSLQLQRVSTSSLRVPLFPVQLLIPLGGLLLTLELLIKIYLLAKQTEEEKTRLV